MDQIFRKVYFGNRIVGQIRTGQNQSVMLYDGEKSEEVMIQVMPSITASTRFVEVKAKFDAYFSPKRNVIFERYKFNSRVQETGETVDSFVTALHSLAETCEYGVLRNDLIRDRIVIGIRDTRASKRLQLINDLTLEKALEIARQAEIQAKEGKTLRHATDEETEVNRVFQKRRNFRKQKSSEDTLRREEQTYGRCGYPNHTPDRKCPALRSTCRRCKKEGHWDRMCRSKEVRHVEQYDTADGDEEAHIAPVFIGVANSLLGETDFQFQAYIPEIFKPLCFIVDTGADITCVSDECIPQVCKKSIRKSGKIILGPDGKKLPLMGCLFITLVQGARKIQATVYVIRGLKRNLLRKPEIKKFNLISTINNIRENSWDSFIQEFPQVFKGIGQFQKELHIQFKEHVKPFFQTVPRTVPIPLLPKLKAELDKLLRLGIIKVVDFPTEWCSPIVVVSKKGSDDVCLCCDYIQLNNSVKRPNFSISKVEVTLAGLKGSTIFTKLDAQSGFYQIRLHESCQPLTTFITPFGRFMFTRLPFGINCASDYFSQMFYDLFHDLSNVAVRVNDILIHTNSMEEHYSILRTVLDRLRSARITLNKSKCIFGVKQVEFLGHLISGKGIDILPSRISAITKFPISKDKESLMQLLGSVNYVSRYLPNK
ncbi:uncharacterized protein K02A2.6-like [Ooceraea biroi]|uniref:uncharacterized protein K02A2.6-like n=1 Tax=Ooceraea biroi TaxID=2015173 RepID=UPI000F0934C7|nr:uncharacterized protein K02A2.6-like [Ooceraea biroi]